MQEIPAIDGTGAIGAPGATTGGVEQTATSAFGFGFEDLLRIVLNQLTYQDPLKPLENFEFVSQLAQFSQIQQHKHLTSVCSQFFRSTRHPRRRISWVQPSIFQPDQP